MKGFDPGADNVAEAVFWIVDLSISPDRLENFCLETWRKDFSTIPKMLCLRPLKV